MRRIIMTLTLGFVLVVALGIFTAQLKAEELNWKMISYISNAQVIPVGDEDGHFLAVIERRGAAIFADGETAACLGTATSDVRKDRQGGAA